ARNDGRTDQRVVIQHGLHDYFDSALTGHITLCGTVVPQIMLSRESKSVPQMMLSSASNVPHMTLRQFAPPQLVPHTMLSSESRSVPQMMLSSDRRSVPQMMLSPSSDSDAPQTTPNRQALPRGLISAFAMRSLPHRICFDHVVAV